MKKPDGLKSCDSVTFLKGLYHNFEACTIEQARVKRGAGGGLLIFRCSVNF
jgi:hypothetical protein